jgi:hypothetical protein
MMKRDIERIYTTKRRTAKRNDDNISRKNVTVRKKRFFTLSIPALPGGRV